MDGYYTNNFLDILCLTDYFCKYNKMKPNHIRKNKNITIILKV